ncbi:MAG: hypothetical protein QOF51_294 [Chloroflexota bacterium]|jgi:hypothetical protein|nr:hypothetical protein [Chloroflexota bacterium]
MGREPSAPELRSRFLYDENLTFVGRALAHVFRDIIAVSADLPELGRGAKDEEHIIPWLVEHRAVWVTKDWQRARNRAYARQLHDLGVSAAWFRPTGRHELRAEEFLWVAAKAMLVLPGMFPVGVHGYAIIDNFGKVTPLPIGRFLRGNV